MKPKVKATKISKTQSLPQDFPKEFMKNPNHELYCICAAARFLATNAFLLKVKKSVSQQI